MITIEKLQQDQRMIIQWSLLDYSYSKEYHKMIEIDSSKQQALDADSKAVNKSILGEIQMEKQQLLKKQSKLFWIFHKNL